MGFCAGCAHWFESRGYKVAYCSIGCANRNTAPAKGQAKRLPLTARRERNRIKNDLRRARIHGSKYEEVDRLAVFARDRWQCGLCGKPVPQSASYPDPRSASLDHIVPVSQGGDHTYANCQLAHFGCNSRKRDRGEPQQLRLIG